jgi:hypothetical protein
MNAHRKLLDSARRGVQMMRYRRHKSRHPIVVECTAVILVIFLAGSLNAQQRGTDPSMVREAASGPSSVYVEPFGVAVSPGAYLANFLLLYFSSPELGANMPAYRAALPQEVYQCLVENPEGCPYSDMAKYLAKQALEIGGSRNKNTFWPSSCQIDPRWLTLAPPEYRQPDQINQPLGSKKADQLARLLGMDQEMILTDEEYQCQIGTPPRDSAREIIFRCQKDFTISNGNAVIPLSSYGLSLNEQGDVRSDCAPEAPCLEFNQLAIDGTLLDIAEECGFKDKLWRLFKQTPFLELLIEAVKCQRDWGPEGDFGRLWCIVETACPGNGGQSNNSCAPSLANPK